MCVPPTGSQAGPFHGWSPGRPGDTGWSLGVPKASPRPCPGHPSRGPPPYPPSTAGRSPGNLTLDGLFLELLTILFAFPMTSNVPGRDPTPAPCAQLPLPLPPAGQEAPCTPLSLPSPALQCPQCHGCWPWRRWSGGGGARGGWHSCGCWRVGGSPSPASAPPPGWGKRLDSPWTLGLDGGALRTCQPPSPHTCGKTRATLY